MGGTRDQADRPPQRAPGRASVSSQKCHACLSTRFESAYDGGLVCIDCGVRLRGFVEEQTDAGVADGGQLRYRVHKAGARKASGPLQLERPTTLMVLEGFQTMLRAQILPLERALGMGSDDTALRLMVRSLWLRCVPLVPPPSSPDAVAKAAPAISIGWRYYIPPSLSPKLALALLLLGCEEAAAERAIRAEDLLEWCRGGVLPLLAFHRSVPDRLQPIVRCLPTVLSPQSLPTPATLDELAVALRPLLGLQPRVVVPRLLTRHLGARLHIPATIVILAEGITELSVEKATKRLKNPKPLWQFWGEAAAALFVACKLRCALGEPLLDLDAQQGAESTEEVEATDEGGGAASAAADSSSDALWREMQPAFVRAVLGSARLCDSLLEPTPSWLKGAPPPANAAEMPSSSTSAMAAPNPAPHTTAAVPWTALELLLLPPKMRCAHAQFCATAVLPEPERCGLYGAQLEALREFEVMGERALATYGGPAVGTASFFPQPPPQDNRTARVADLLDGESAEVAAERYVRCSSLPALHCARYALCVRALATEAHIPAWKLERATKKLEKKLLPPPATKPERSRKRPWDAEQLMACMEGWV